MRRTSRASLHQTDLGRALGVKHDQSSLAALSKVWTVWSQDPIKSLNDVIKPLSKVWTAFPESVGLIRTFSRLWKVCWEPRGQTKTNRQSPREEEIVYPQVDYFSGSTSQFYFVNIKDPTKDWVLIIAVELSFFYCYV